MSDLAVGKESRITDTKQLAVGAERQPPAAGPVRRTRAATAGPLTKVSRP
jgi:hypothetical protein